MNFEDLKIKLPESKKKKLDKTLRVTIYSVFSLAILSFVYFIVWGTK
jgi:hypothetical protein